MQKRNKRILSCILCLLCMLALLPTAALAADAVDLSRDVRLTLEYEHNSIPVADVPFELYYVADMDENAEFTLAGDFQSYPVELNGLTAEEWRALADTLAVYADRDGLYPLDSGKTNELGYLSFPNQRSSLKPGLYLVVGRQLVQDGYTYTTEPFLVSLPNYDETSATWSYDVLAAPKHTQTENPPEPSDRTVERRVLKVWKDDLAEVRPQEVTIELLRDGVVYDTVVLNAQNSWRYVWPELPEYNEDGSKIVWRVVESEIEDYTVLITRDGVTFTVTNTYALEEPADETVTRTVLKIWEDKGYENRRPKSVKVTLLQNDTAYDSQTLNDANGWMYTWEELPKYDANGTEIVWSVREDAVTGYIPSVRQNGFTLVITNTIDKQKLPQTGVLWWPVPVLAAAGLAFVIVGMASKKKKNS